MPKSINKQIALIEAEYMRASEIIANATKKLQSLKDEKSGGVKTSPLKNFKKLQHINEALEKRSAQIR